MKINEPLRSAAGARRVATGRAPAGSAFAPPAARAGRAPGAPPGAPLAALDGVLALQEVQDAPSGRRRTVERGHDLLDELENLRLAMIEGWLSERALRRLSELIEVRADAVDDDRLEGVLREIEVRAAVEIAKRDRRDEPGDRR